MNIIATIEPLPGIPPSARHVSELVGFIGNNGVSFIVQDVYHSSKAARFLAEKTGVRMVQLPHDIGSVLKPETCFRFSPILSRGSNHDRYSGTCFSTVAGAVGHSLLFRFEDHSTRHHLTDLAIGQMSALGAAVSLFLLDGRWSYIFAVGFALAAGLLITVGCGRSRHQEAFIGLLYALGLSGVFLLLSRSPHGMEKFNELMAADILFTPKSQIVRVAGWYALIGIILAWSQKKLAGHWRELCFFGVSP